MDWKDMKPLSIQADGYPELFLFGGSVSEDGSMRLVPRVRPFQDGAKQDDTGANADSYILELLFMNELEEPGVDNGKPMYPDVLQDLRTQSKSGKVMTLNLPWERGIRVKADKWSRKEVASDNRNGAVVTLTLQTDNEDSVDREALVRVSAKATISRAVEEAQFDAESQGVWHGSLADLTGFAADLVGYLNSPNEYAQSITHAANRVKRAVNTVLQAFSQRGAEGRDQLEDPAGSELRQKLMGIADLASQAESEARQSQRRVRDYIPTRDTDIWSIATELQQSYRDLIELNDQLEDVGFIPRGAPVRVYAD